MCFTRSWFLPRRLFASHACRNSRAKARRRADKKRPPFSNGTEVGTLCAKRSTISSNDTIRLFPPRSYVKFRAVDKAQKASSAQSSNRELIEMLRRSRLFREYETVFGKATGLPLALRPLEYCQLAHHGKKN